MSRFDEHNSLSEIVDIIDKIVYPGGGTKTGQALVEAKALFDSGARKGVSNIACVITDGKSKDDITIPAQELRNSGVTVFSVGIGTNYDLKELQEMATNPDSEHTFKAEFDALKYIVNTIIGSACKGRQIFCFCITFLAYSILANPSFTHMQLYEFFHELRSKSIPR